MLKTLPVALLALTLLSGCAQSLPFANDDINTHYKTTQSPPPGFGRVYVFAPVADTLFISTVQPGAVKAGPDEGHTALVGYNSNKKFIAFDARPGQLYIKWYGGSSLEQKQYFNITDGQTVRLCPISVNK